MAFCPSRRSYCTRVWRPERLRHSHALRGGLSASLRPDRRRPRSVPLPLASKYPAAYNRVMVEIRQTEVHARWFGRLRDIRRALELAKEL